MKEIGKEIVKIEDGYLKLRTSLMVLPEYTPIKYPRKPGNEIFEICFDVSYTKLIIVQKSRRSHSGRNLRDISRLVVL